MFYRKKFQESHDIADSVISFTKENTRIRYIICMTPKLQTAKALSIQ